MVLRHIWLTANYTDSDTTKYMGRVVYDTDTYDQTLEEEIGKW